MGSPPRPAPGEGAADPGQQIDRASAAGCRGRPGGRLDIPREGWP